MARHLTDAQFVDLLASSQGRLEVLALALVRPRTDADDVLQNASITLWEKRGEYDADRKFFPWASGVVMIEVLRYRQKKAKDKLVFDEALIGTLSTEYVTQADELDLRRQLLPYCIAKLSDGDRELLEDRYDSNVALKKMSEQRSRPLPTLYSALARIRVSLFRCIEAKLAQQDRS